MEEDIAIKVANEYTGSDIMRDDIRHVCEWDETIKTTKIILWREALGFVIVCIGVWPDSCDLILSK